MVRVPLRDDGPDSVAQTSRRPAVLTSNLKPLLTRRSLNLMLGGAALPLGLGFGRVAEAANEGAAVHGLSIFGDLALPADFPHLPYVNPTAPKGGQILLQITSTSGNQTFETFNTLNVYNEEGDGAAGVPAIFDSLLTGSADEPDALYGLVARSVMVASDKLTYVFQLRKEARFHDGSPMTAADVVFSINVLRDKGHTTFRLPLRDLDVATATAPDVVTIRLKPAHSRDAILFIAALPIFSAAFYAKTPFDAVSLEPPLGSGAYKVGRFEQGKYVALELVADYWAKDLPINVGTNNFQTIRYEYYADRKIAFEGFKAGDFTFHEELVSAVWAKAYDFPAVTEGRIKKEFIPDDTPMGTQGWFFNARRDKFHDPRIREAMGYAFDFKWTNANIMYNAYQRTVSYFQNSPMVATGVPSPEELKILEPFRSKLPAAVFGPVAMPPEGDGSGSDRTMLRKGFDLLKDAGCKRDGQTLLLPDGKPFEVEFLDSSPALEPHTLPFIRNLRQLGIQANLRIVDPAQYKHRLDNFDFDVITERFGFGLTPGAAMRDSFGSEAAKLPSSRNLCGIADPVVDALIEKAVVADDRETLTVLCKCIDRVLRAGFYWVPMWNKAGHTVAYWNLFDRPTQNAKYGLNVLSTWWYDEAKAKTTNLRPR
jgi:microcin C transport system substrate-binding protein